MLGSNVLEDGGGFILSLSLSLSLFKTWIKAVSGFLRSRNWTNIAPDVFPLQLKKR
jgi:hypothetical protein